MSLHGQTKRLPEVVVLPRLFESMVLAHPFSPALKDAGDTRWHSYLEVNQKANKLARCLLKQISGATCFNPDGDRVVAVCMAPSSHLVTALLAIHKAGGCYLPLDVTFPESRVAHILQDARPALLLAHGHPKPVQAAHNSPVVENNVPVLHLEDLEEEIEKESDEELTPGEVGLVLRGTSIATILYTSGSTGIPKGVRISHRAALNRLAWQWHTFPYHKDEVCCFKTALTFVDSVSEIFGPLLTGHRVVVIPKSMTQAVDELVGVLDEERVGRLVLVPSLLRSILLHCSSTNSPKLHHLRLWVCSGEVFPSDLLISFFKTFNNGQSICNFYGSTEVMGDVTSLRFPSRADAEARLTNNKVPIGAPITNCRLYLLDSEGRQVPDGKIGEVFAAGLNVASGYVGGAQPDKFITNIHCNDPDYSLLYRTGDYGRVVDGVVVFEGRTDSQIKVRGHRVDLSEVNAAVQKVEGVDKTYVLCYRPGEVNQALVAFYTSPEEKLVPEVLKMRVMTLLQPYMVPQLVHLDDLPLLVNGKVDRQQLLKVYESKAEEEQQHLEVDLTGVGAGEEVAARDLLLTVARVLGPSIARDTKLSLDVSFYDLGGNSLNSVLTVTSLKDFDYDIGISQFMKAKTLREVLMHMKKTKQEEEEPEVPPCGRRQKGNYNCYPLAREHVDAVLELISKSFSKKGDLESWVRTEPREYIDFLSPIMETLIDQGFSFVLTRPETNEVVATALNFDLHREPELENLSPNLEYILGFIDDCESTVRDQLPSGKNEVLHSFIMGTLLELGPAENVELIQLMEEENLRLAKSKGLKAVFTTNTSSLTQQVCDDLLSYKVLSDNQVNLWVAPDGMKPFGKAPDSQRIVITVKFL